MTRSSASDWRVTIDGFGTPTPVGDDLWLPSEAVTACTNADGRSVELWMVHEGGEWSCRRVTVSRSDGGEVGRDDLAVPLAGLVRRAGDALALLVTRRSSGQRPHYSVAMDDEGEVFRQRARRPYRHLDDRHLAEVAAVYVDAVAEGRPPRAAVAEHWKAKSNTASNWVALARERGFLTAAGRRKAGGELTARARRLLGREDGT